jgi:hypothetical protein
LIIHQFPETRLLYLEKDSNKTKIRTIATKNYYFNTKRTRTRTRKAVQESQHHTVEGVLFLLKVVALLISFSWLAVAAEV